MTQAPHTPLDPDEQALARRYRALPGGEPPPELDARVRAHAHAAAMASRPHLRPWVWGVSTAAAAVLALGVLWKSGLPPTLEEVRYREPAGPVPEVVEPFLAPQGESGALGDTASQADAALQPSEAAPEAEAEERAAARAIGAASRAQEARAADDAAAGAASGPGRPPIGAADRDRPSAGAERAPPARKAVRPFAPDPPAAPPAPPPPPAQSAPMEIRQAAPTSAPADELDEVTVTGSRLKRPVDGRDEPAPRPAVRLAEPVEEDPRRDDVRERDATSKQVTELERAERVQPRPVPKRIEAEPRPMTAPEPPPPSPPAALAPMDAEVAEVLHANRDTSPARWLERIVELLDAGERDAARVQLEAFRVRHPDHALPDAVHALLDEAE